MLREIQIGEEIIDLNEVDFIALNQIEDEVAGKCHCITFFTRNKEDVLNLYKSKTIKSVEKNWNMLSDFMEENCPQFGDFNGEMLINCERITDFKIDGKFFGPKSFTLCFKDGYGFVAYENLTRESASMFKDIGKDMLDQYMSRMEEMNYQDGM